MIRTVAVILIAGAGIFGLVAGAGKPSLAQQNCYLSPVTGDMVCDGDVGLVQPNRRTTDPNTTLGGAPPSPANRPIAEDTAPIDGDGECETVTHTRTETVMVQNDSGNSVPLRDENGNEVLASSTYEETVCGDEGTGQDPGYWTRERSLAAVCIAEIDDAELGYCAKGVANIMLAMGYPVTRGNAYTWKDSLPANGWDLHGGSNSNPADCPPGGILVFDRDDPPGDGGGSEYGHVEIVVETPQRSYVSDTSRRNSGGSVPDNYVGCFVYPEPTTPTGAYARCMAGVE